MSEKQYLENIANKVKLYAEAKEQAIQWLVGKKITDKNKIQKCPRPIERRSLDESHS